MSANPDQLHRAFEQDPEPESAPRPILVEGENCWKIARADRAAFLIDGENYFSAFARAALLAQESILIVGWDFDSRMRLRPDDSAADYPAVLGDFLNYLVRRRRKLKISILAWDFPMVYGADREATPLFGSGWRRSRHIRLEYDGRIPVGASHHQKLVIFDNSMAFAGGLDLTRKRWDTTDHQAHHVKRTCEGTPYPPFHDVMMAVDGPIAAHLGSLARRRWHQATGEMLYVSNHEFDPWPEQLNPDMVGVDVAISRTEPAYAGSEAVREVEQLYIDAISAAQRSIYIENQYFTSSRIGDAIAARLEEPIGPEIIVVLRLASNGWLEGVTMGAMRDSLVKRLREVDRHNRLHVYYPMVPDLGNECINVHSKVLIIDDRFVRVGSANLNNRSMTLDTECDLSIESNNDLYVEKAIANFRNSLLSEHLGAPRTAVARSCKDRKSLHKAIHALRNNERWLESFRSVDEWPEGVASIASYLDPEKPVPLDKLMDEFSPDTNAAPRGSIFLKITLVLMFLGMLVAGWRWTALREWATVENVTMLAAAVGNNPFAPVLFIAAYTVAAFAFFPRPLITMATVLTFGAKLGFIYAIVGITLSALATYGVGRVMNRHTVRRLAGSKLNNLVAKLSQTSFLSVAAIRLLPVAPFVLENIVAGAVRMRLNHYTFGTMLGMLPGTIASTIFGDQMTTYLQSNGQFNYLIVMGVVVFWVAIFFGVRAWWKKQPVH